MATRIFTVTDLGGGDGGKGGVVHKISSMLAAHTVVKVGGAQGSHGVRTSRGESFNFSHFGCGTFEGCRTLVSRNFVIDPGALLAEGELLEHGHGLRGTFSRIAVDGEALCVTPFHRIASRLRELARKDKPKGTIGTGVGEAYGDAESDPSLAIRASEIGSPGLRDKLEAVRRRKLVELGEIVDGIGDLWPDDRSTATELVTVLSDERAVEATVWQWETMRMRVRIVPSDYLANEVLARDGTVVVESSHGVLTDRYCGFHPHTTRLRTLPRFTHEMLKEAGYDGEVVRLGVTRAYQIRHGAGPMPTEAPFLAEKLLPGSSKDENRWQGKVRVGPLDLVALRYAIGCCGGPEAFDGLAVTWFDQIPVFGSWPICDRYADADDPEFFDHDGEILVRRGEDAERLAYQQALGERLRDCLPHVAFSPLREGRDALVDLCSETLGNGLGVPVSMISFGPTEDDKVCI